MSDTFDPYHRWLGIPPKDQPPDHYRLLSVERFESHADVIAEAADRQMAHLRTRQSGHHADLAARLLNEIAAARVCLLSPSRKAAYDARLAESLTSRPPTANQHRWAMIAAAIVFCLFAGWTISTVWNSGNEHPQRDLLAQRPGTAASPNSSANEADTASPIRSTADAEFPRRTNEISHPPEISPAPESSAHQSTPRAVSSPQIATGVWHSIENGKGRVKLLPAEDAPTTVPERNAHSSLASSTERSPQAEVDHPLPSTSDATTSAGPKSSVPIESQTSHAASSKLTTPSDALPSDPEIARYVLGKYPLAIFALSADGQRIVTCNTENQLFVIDLKAGREIQTLAGADLQIEHLAVVPDGRFFMASGITADEDLAQLRTYRVDDARELTTFASTNGPVTALAINDNGLNFAMGHRLGAVSLNSTQTSMVPVVFFARERTAEITALAFSSDNQQLVFGDRSGEAHIALISARKPNVQQHLTAHHTAIQALGISSQGDLLLTAAADGAITLWQNWRGRDSAKAKLKFSTGKLQPGCAALAPAGNLIATASETGEITLWDATSGKPAATLAGHTTAIIGLSFLPDGQRLASASRDGTVRIWNSLIK